jgi:hypothetical protein
VGDETTKIVFGFVAMAARVAAAFQAEANAGVGGGVAPIRA